VGFEPTTAVFEREKTFHALYCVASVIGYLVLTFYNYEQGCVVTTLLHETKRIVYGHISQQALLCFSEFIYMLPCNEVNMVEADFSKVLGESG
jgi:hypothetical protein